MTLPFDLVRPDRTAAATPEALVVSRYLGDLATTAVHLPEADRAALEESTLRLLRALLTANPGAAPPPPTPLGSRMLEYVQVHVVDRDLTIAEVARVHGISERYAYLILQRAGISLADRVRGRRLAGAAEELRRVHERHVTVSEIAHRWGFPDHANFTRAFHRAYGMSPRDYRKRCGQEPGGSVREPTTICADPIKIAKER
ncbi:helix-turn-helix transcriptional regulator [Curtobacterium sp. PhB136]|uniref:helix-turn-helix transcriptional regulator n=1 Tax=Curtobacterium sp. PhB136 TaxID=2485181 RepID=UPI00104DB614|nr:helix-turn-helix transcriptional regulator [Curtobacterium sp. PhB136]TCK65737.1 AraC-like DNA-binding protein [Curtobacterium sp. PhB136]